MGEFSPPPPLFFLSPLLSFLFFFLIPQILIGSITLLQKFTPHFKILDPRLLDTSIQRPLLLSGRGHLFAVASVLFIWVFTSIKRPANYLSMQNSEIS